MEFVKQQKLSFQKPGEASKLVQPKKSIDLDLLPAQANKKENDMENSEETELNKDGFFWNNEAGAVSVRVALRVRPLIQHELENGKIWVKWIQEENQVLIGKDRSFTFDTVFDMNAQQQPIFEIWVKNLVLGWFSGYNATVLAYGQTGSGKTFTMGSGHTIGIDKEMLGIIPRVITFIFDEISKRSSKAEFIVKCSFLEIYNEEIHDLLDINAEAGVDRYLHTGKDIAIREEKNGNISVYGLQEEKVDTSEELASLLDRGSNLRITSSTLMNSCSSRSHAIFTVIIEQHRIEDLYQSEEKGQKDDEML